MNTKNFPENKARKQREAKERQEAYDKLTIQEKLDKLPANGAQKQRDKLQAQLDIKARTNQIRTDKKL